MHHLDKRLTFSRAQRFSKKQNRQLKVCRSRRSCLALISFSVSIHRRSLFANICAGILARENTKPIHPETTTATEGTPDAGASAHLPTFEVQVGASPLVPFPEKTEDTSKLLASIDQPGLERGALYQFQKKQLHSLAEDFATKAPDGANYMRNEPSELTEQMWGTVLRNNRAFHGYHIENVKGHNTPIKAPKPGKSPFGRSCLYFGRSSSCDTDYLLSII